ncbi:unnamed protein product [Psylliodes chrysocephalus]|uniref:C2H2-type domain-containing protein n=1 Tax=Psylliodes chrysocephalus TaxID=3402493 RepID=A0A9P0CYQ7_9CUCU|nr:unnamed protein product [Psylliodes chrysocephala]
MSESAYNSPLFSRRLTDSCCSSPARSIRSHNIEDLTDSDGEGDQLFTEVPGTPEQTVICGWLKFRDNKKANTLSVSSNNCSSSGGGAHDTITEENQGQSLPGSSGINNTNIPKLPILDDNIENTFLNLIRPPLPEFDLKTLLETSPLGNSILNYYLANGALDQKRRRRLVDIINLDFDRMCPGKGLNFHNLWPSFFNKVLELKKQDLTNYNDPHIQALLDSLDIIQEYDSKIATQVMLLPHLIPPKSRTVVAKKHWKFSIQEAVENLLVLVKVEMKCIKCSKFFSNFNQYILYLECYHNSSSNYFVCPIPSCSRIYHRKNSLKQHMNIIHQANFCHDNLAKNTDDKNIINESYSTSDTHIEDNILGESVAVTEDNLQKLFADFQSLFTISIEK